MGKMSWLAAKREMYRLKRKKKKKVKKNEN